MSVVVSHQVVVVSAHFSIEKVARVFSKSLCDYYDKPSLHCANILENSFYLLYAIEVEYIASK